MNAAVRMVLMVAGALAIVALAGWIFFMIIGNFNRAPRNADGAFEGVVTSVSRDRMRLETDSGDSVRIDTWSVCGDNTNRHISTGDRIVVYADRDLFDYEAWRILDATGQPACPR